MTREELRQYIEERLLAYDPLIDLTEGGDAYSQVVAPVLDKLGPDVLEMDVPEFIKDRLWQEYRIGVTDGDGISDLFIKPHALVLEPFKRSINALKRNQSLRYPELLTDDDADALAANWFTNRNQGTYAAGSVRVYFAVPSAQTVSPNIRFFTDSGLNFFPTITQSVAADQMLFQRDGSEYYMDVMVRAENPGEDYTLAPGEIKGAEGLGNSVRATNLRRFSVGLRRETTEEFAARSGESLTERSLTSGRGNRARILETFTDVVNLELVGYGDSEMQRDILKGEGDGLLYASGKALCIKQYALVFSGFEDRGDGTRRPEIGDPFVLNYHAPFFLENSQQRPWEQRTERFRIANILFSSLDAGFIGWPGTFLIELDRLPLVNEMTWLPLAQGTIITSFAMYKPGMITISDMPGGIQAPNTAEGHLQIRTDEVHVGGHYDAYIRPSAAAEDALVLENVTDNLPLLSGTYLQTFAAPNANVVGSGGATKWREVGVEPGYTLVIESGLDAGEYTIMGVGVGATDEELYLLYLGRDLTGGAATNIRFRILDELNIDLVNPRNQIFPSSGGTPSDLTTVAGSDELILSTFDLNDYGVVAGNVLRIEDGADAGEYIIEDLTNGKRPVLDTEMTADGVALHYSVYVAQTGIQMPLVRIKSVEVLNSDGEPSGLTVPYSEPVMATNRCCFTGSEFKCDSPYGFVAPDLREFKPDNFGTGCQEPADLADEMTDGYTVDQTWYSLAATCVSGEDCIPSWFDWDGVSMMLWARRHWSKMFGNEAGFDKVATDAGGSGSNDPMEWNDTDWAYAIANDTDGSPVVAPWQDAIVPPIVSLSRILTHLALGDFALMRTNEILEENPELIETGDLPWDWVIKDDSTYELAGGDLDPFRIRRYYSDGALDCEGYLICICLDYNTQFEICLPKALFDECNNMFVSLPEFGLSSVLDSLEQSLREHTPASGPFRQEDIIPFHEIIQDIFKPACLCGANAGDVVTLERGPNAGSYIVEELHTIRLDLSLLLDEGEQKRFFSEFEFAFSDEDLGGLVAIPIPLDICLVKIEGQFPSGMLQWFNKLFSADGVTLEGLFGTGYTRLLDFAVKALGMNDTTGRAALESMWELNKNINLREFFNLEDFIPIPWPTTWGCTAGELELPQGVLGLFRPTTAWDEWADWEENFEAFYSGVSRELLAIGMVMLRRIDAYGLGGLMEFLLPEEPDYRVESIAATEPVDPDVGDLYVIGLAGSGWAGGSVNDIMECTGITPSWAAPVTPTGGETMWVRDTTAYYTFDAGPAWGWDREGPLFFEKLFDRFTEAGWNYDALVYGGGLPAQPYYWFIETLGDKFIELTADLADKSFIVSSIFALLDRGIYLLVTLPLQTVWGYATEDNPDMLPENMIVDIGEVIDNVLRMLLTPYSSGSSICDNYIRAYFMEPTSVEFDAGLDNCSLQWERIIPSYFATRVGESELLFSASSQVSPREIVPFRETEPIADVDLPRGIEMRDVGDPPDWDLRNQWRFTDEALGAPVTHGVLPGRDFLELFEQRFLCPAPEIGLYYVLDKDRTDPSTAPALSPSDGDHYIVGVAGGGGLWGAFAANDVIQWVEDTSLWTLVTAAGALIDGDTAQVADEGRLYVWDLGGGAWVVGECAPSHKDVVPGLISARDSAIVRIPSSAIYGWNNNQVGEMIFIEKGDDVGGYKIVEVLDGKRARIDRALTHTTEAILRGGFRATFDFRSSGTFTIPAAVETLDPAFSNDDVGRYITIYSCYFPDCNGSYEIASYTSPTEVVLDISTWSGTGCPLPASSLAVNGNGQWAITDAPVDTPELYTNDDVGNRETVATVPFRQYHATPRAFPISAIESLLDISTAYITLGTEDGYPRDGLHQPFKITRPGVQRFSSTEMAENREDGLYYVDVLVKSLGAGAVYNLPENSRFWPIFGSYKSDGYRYVVGDTNYAFSPDEQVGLIISPQVLPVGNEDRASFRVSLAGQTLQVRYEHAPTVMSVHQFINSRADRPLCANPMARHFLPAYPYIFVTYRGGADPDSLAEKVQDLIRDLGPLDAIQIDNVEAIVKKAGADYIEHPIAIRAAILDLRRRWVVIESFDYLHSNAENPEFLGSDRLTFFIAPDDTSRAVEAPAGPQVRLIKSPAGPRVR